MTTQHLTSTIYDFFCKIGLKGQKGDAGARGLPGPPGTPGFPSSIANITSRTLEEEPALGDNAGLVVTSSGVVYVLWGRMHCPPDTSLIYSG